MRPFHPLMLLLALASPAAAQTHPYDFAPLDKLVKDAVTAVPLAGASMWLHKEGVDLYRRHYGTFTEKTVVPIASASKWISGTVIMILVDRGTLSLDDPVSKHLASFTGTKGTITIRQCFAHTSGLPGKHPITGAKSVTLAQAADYIGRNVALKATPGTVFEYGGVSMHVAGACAAKAAGKDWEVLLKEVLAGPLGMTTVDYQGLGATTNYRIAGGARASLEDYGRLLRLLLQRGVWGSKRILSEKAVQTMFRDQTGGARIVGTPQPDSRRYGVGVWLDRVDAAKRTLQVSSQGAFGFSPWIDLERNLAGVFMVQDQLKAVYDPVDKMQAWTRGALPWAGLLAYGASTPACTGPISAGGSDIPYAGNAAFALTLLGAPPATAGVVLLGFAPDLPGTALLGVGLHVAAVPGPLVLPAVTDPLGACTLALPLTGVASGARTWTQALWANTPGCGGLGTLSAGPGLELVVQRRWW